VRDYDAAMNLIVEADMLTRRLLVGADANQGGDNAVPSQAGPSHTNINLTEEERWKVEDGKYHVELPSTTQMPDVQLPPPGFSSDPHKPPISSRCIDVDDGDTFYFTPPELEDPNEVRTPPFGSCFLLLQLLLTTIVLCVLCDHNVNIGVHRRARA
jgi:hypothetical protein